jgi:hypothetical protein
MGYTHYFQLHSEPTQTRWDTFTSGVNSIIRTSEVPLEAEITGSRVILNGIGEDSHETLFIQKGDIKWNFCKTAQKDYDEVVTAILILARYVFPDLSLSSDGDWNEWRMGRELFTKAMYLEPTEGTVFGNKNHVYEWKLENA